MSSCSSCPTATGPSRGSSFPRSRWVHASRCIVTVLPALGSWHHRAPAAMPAATMPAWSEVAGLCTRASSDLQYLLICQLRTALVKLACGQEVSLACNISPVNRTSALASGLPSAMLSALRALHDDIANRCSSAAISPPQTLIVWEFLSTADMTAQRTCFSTYMPDVRAPCC